MFFDDTTQTLWDAYLAAEKDRIRAVTMPALDRFIEAALKHERPVWHTWACNLAQQVADKQLDIPIRFPLFQRILLPALTHGIIHKRQGCARWLAHFNQQLYHSDCAELPVHLQSKKGLLREALRIDPEDRLARTNIVEELADYFEYTLHELPAGVLYGANSASVVECEELLKLLNEFSAHVEYLGRTNEFSTLIMECSFHFRTYKEYLLKRMPNDCYEQFLDRK